MKAIVIGSTGLVGECLLQLLDKDDRFSEISALVRKPGNILSTKVKYKTADFEKLDSSLFHGDVLFCALGTTLKKAGSKGAQYKIDCAYNFNAALLAKQNGVKTLAHVSSLGANEKSANFYLKTKGELENKLKELNFDKTIIVRPSIIFGKRKEFRLGEKIGIGIIKAMTFLMVGSLKKYRGAYAQQIAKCLIEEACNINTKGFNIIENDKILNY